LFNITTAILTILLMINHQGHAQKKELKLHQNINQEAFKADSSVYANAIANGDFPTAIVALYYLLEHNPAKNNYRDSLAYMYFLNKQYDQSIQVCEYVLNQTIPSAHILYWAGASYHALGNIEMAVEKYIALYSLDPNVNHLFQISEYQYLLKQYNNCEQTIQQVLDHPKLNESTIFIHISKKEQQQVPMAAAMYNLLGLLYNDLEQNDKAMVAFNKAIEIYPGFLLARQKLAILDQEVIK